MAKATQTTKTTTSYKVNITLKSSAENNSDTGKGLVTCHMCGVGKVPASWYNGGNKKK